MCKSKCDEPRCYYCGVWTSRIATDGGCMDCWPTAEEKQQYLLHRNEWKMQKLQEERERLLKDSEISTS